MQEITQKDMETMLKNKESMEDVSFSEAEIKNVLHAF